MVNRVAGYRRSDHAETRVLDRTSSVSKEPENEATQVRPKLEATPTGFVTESRELSKSGTRIHC